MGWTGINQANMDGMSAREYLNREFTFENENGSSCSVLKSAMVGNTYYAAVKRTFPLASGDAPIVFGLVCLTTRGKSHFWPGEREFCYKDMDESMGPCERDCPLSILDMLSEPEGEWAKQWRLDCRANAAKKRERKAITEGARIKLSRPMQFADGRERDEFTVVKLSRRGKMRTYFRGLDGALCRFALSRADYSVL